MILYQESLHLFSAIYDFSVEVVVWPSSGCIIYFLAIKNRSAPNIASTRASPCAPPFGTATKYAIENITHVIACKVYLMDSHILFFFAINPSPKNTMLG